MNQLSLFEIVAKLKFSDFISVFALVISGTSILWNVYRDIILKARLKVHIQISNIIHPEKRLGPFIDITGVNHGPGSITCESVFIKTTLWKRVKGEKKFGYVIPDYLNPLTDKLPKKLEVGEKITLLFQFYQENILSHSNPSVSGGRM